MAGRAWLEDMRRRCLHNILRNLRCVRLPDAEFMLEMPKTCFWLHFIVYVMVRGGIFMIALPRGAEAYDVEVIDGFGNSILRRAQET